MGVNLLPRRKRELRGRMKSRLALLRPDESPFLAERLRERVALWVRCSPGLWGTYRPMAQEADPLLQNPEDGVEWCFPRLTATGMEFARGDQFERSLQGFEQPVSSAPRVSLDEMTGVLVPGLAFDRQGGRLGRGRGYYDRALEGYRGMKVGIAFSCQILERIPLEAWDLRMDAIITEQFVIKL